MSDDAFSPTRAQLDEQAREYLEGESVLAALDGYCSCGMFRVAYWEPYALRIVSELISAYNLADTNALNKFWRSIRFPGGLMLVIHNRDSGGQPAIDVDTLLLVWGELRPWRIRRALQILRGITNWLRREARIADH